MYKGVSAAYTIIVVSYWTLAFSGYWAFGSQVQPYILSSLTAPRWAIAMANLFAVIQIAGCFQVKLLLLPSTISCYNHQVTVLLHQDILQANVCALRRAGSGEEQELRILPVAAHVHFCIHGSDHRRLRSNAVLWGFCINLWSSWFHPSGLCAACIRTSED